MSKFRKLDEVAAYESVTYLEDNGGEEWLAGVREAVANGATPDDVYRHMVNKLIGPGRDQLAWRCKLAAAALVAEV